MTNVLNILTVQSALVWENPQSNRDAFDNLLADTKADLIVLPEMFSTGFTMEPARNSESMDGETVNWMRRKASELDSAICGSLVIEDGGKFYNRFLFVEPSGRISTYNKRHLFSLAGEDKEYSTSGERLIVNYRGWKICPLVCYDLRFPVYSRNDVDYDLLIYVANWPAPRIAAWDALLKARAIENMAYVVGVNRIGTDGNGHRYPGHSQVLDHFGNAIVDSREQSGTFLCEIDRDQMLHAREKLGFLNDRDQFTVA